MIKLSHQLARRTVNLICFAIALLLSPVPAEAQELSEFTQDIDVIRQIAPFQGGSDARIRAFARYIQERDVANPVDRDGFSNGSFESALPTETIAEFNRVDISKLTTELENTVRSSPFGLSSQSGTLLTTDLQTVQIDRVLTISKVELRAAVQAVQEADLITDATAELFLQSDALQEPTIVGDDLETILQSLVQNGDLSLANSRSLRDQIVGQYTTVTQSTGGVVWPIDGSDDFYPTNPFPGLGGVVSPVFSTGETTNPLLVSSAGNVTTVAGTPGQPCGADTWETKSHCAYYTVMITYDGRLICTGVRISDTHVLTAAHCICPSDLGGDPKNLEIFLGQTWSRHVLMPRETDPVSFYVGRENGVCGSHADRRRWGDLAIIHLDEARAPLIMPQSDVQDLTTDLQALGSVGAKEAGMLVAAVGEMNSDQWKDFTETKFASFGFGVGPDLKNGLMRSGMTTLRESDVCVATEKCLRPPLHNPARVLEAAFQDDSFGICNSDSGGGVFKPVKDHETGIGKWAVVGIMSGGPETSACHTSGNQLFEKHKKRIVVRLDTPDIARWLDETTDGAIRRVGVSMFYPGVQTAAAGDIGG